MRKFLAIAFAALTLAIAAPVASKAATPAETGIAAAGVVAPASKASTAAGAFDNCYCYRYRYTYRVRYYRVRYVPVRYTYRYRYAYRVTYRW